MRGWTIGDRVLRHQCCMGGRGGRSGGGGGGGGGGASGSGGGGGGAATAEPQSVRNALGIETAYGGEERTVANSRLFGAREQASDISNWKSQSADTQAGMIVDIVNQIKPRSGSDSPLTVRASKDLAKLWSNSSSEAKDIAAKSGLGELVNVRNPTARSIVNQAKRRADRIQAQEEAARKARRANRKSSAANEPSLNDLFGF